MTQRLPCPFCSNAHPRWRAEAIVLPDDGAIVCGDMACGAQVSAMNEAEGWKRWNTRTSERVPDGARMANCSICKQEFPRDYLSAGVCASCRPQAGWVQS